MRDGPVAAGFRGFVDGFAYVCLSGTQEQPRVVARGRLRFPAGQDGSEGLCWLRKQLQELLDTHEIRSAYLKTVEPTAKKKASRRLHVEGVIMEALYTMGGVVVIPRIKQQLRRDIREFTQPARYLERVLTEYPYLEELNTAQLLEATLAAVAALPVN